MIKIIECKYDGFVEVYDGDSVEIYEGWALVPSYIKVLANQIGYETVDRFNITIG